MEYKQTHPHTECRVCGGPLTEVMDFGRMPLSNGLQPDRESALNAPRYEQRLMTCHSCKLGQLSLVVSPEVLYKDYVYKSSVSGVFREHCAGLAESLRVAAVHSMGIGSVVDIAGNDGACMREVLAVIPDARGFVVDVAQDDAPADYVKVKDFWNTDTAAEFVRKHGYAGAFIAQNVVGHVDDIHDFFRAVRSSIDEDGLFVIEVPSFKAMIENRAFDTIYHEHVSYWSVTAMTALAGRHGFDVANVVFFPAIHCGTLRFWLRPGTGFDHAPACVDMIAQEKAFFSPGWIVEFNQGVDLDVARVKTMLQMIAPYSDIIGVTASAKSNVFLNFAQTVHGLDPLSLLYLVDDTPEKQGKFSPGTDLEINPMSPETVAWADVAVILSRNLTGALSARLRSLGFKGLILSL